MTKDPIELIRDRWVNKPYYVMSRYRVEQTFEDIRILLALVLAYEHEISQVRSDGGFPKSPEEIKSKIFGDKS